MENIEKLPIENFKGIDPHMDQVSLLARRSYINLAYLINGYLYRQGITEPVSYLYIKSASPDILNIPTRDGRGTKNNPNTPFPFLYMKKNCFLDTPPLKYVKI